MHAAIEMFTGSEMRATEVQHLINHPANAINMEFNARASMNQNLAWGIEARSVNNEVRVIILCGADTDMNLIVEVLFPCR